jgi:hypothetical protein
MKLFLKYKLILLVFFVLFNIISCDSCNTISITWIDLYDIKSIDFKDYPIELSFRMEEYYEKEKIIHLNPNIDKTIKLEEGYCLFGWSGMSALHFMIYPNIKEPFEYKNLEFFLFKNVLPNEENKLVFKENKQVLAYCYNYKEDDKIYTIISRKNIISLDISNSKFLDGQEYTIDQLLTLSENESIYYCSKFMNLFADEFDGNYTEYIVKSNIDDKVFYLEY